MIRKGTRWSCGNRSSFFKGGMKHSIAERLAPIASLAAQRRYIVHGTSEEYCLPSELLNDADDVIRQVRTMTAVRDTLSTTAVQTLLDLERLLDAAGNSVDSIASNEELVEGDTAWRAVREHAALCLTAMNFDLHEWEMKEGLSHTA